MSLQTTSPPRTVPWPDGAERHSYSSSSVRTAHRWIVPPVPPSAERKCTCTLLTRSAPTMPKSLLSPPASRPTRNDAISVPPFMPGLFWSLVEVTGFDQHSAHSCLSTRNGEDTISSTLRGLRTPVSSFSTAAASIQPSRYREAALKSCLP
eukprot:scaffold53950_cov58-Phaeocystis_antarctica.AAC.2